MHDQVIIKVEDSKGKKDIFSISTTEEGGSIDHFYVCGRKRKQISTTNISKKEFGSIVDTFDALNYTKIYEEIPFPTLKDGWTLNCTATRAFTTITIEVRCPSKNEYYPETSKLLDACEHIFNLSNYKLIVDQ